MPINEIILFVLVIILLLLPKYVLGRLSLRTAAVIKLVTALIMLALVWFFPANIPLALKILLTVLAIAGMAKTGRDLKSDDEKEKKSTDS